MEAGFADEPEGQGIGGLITQAPTILNERKWWIIIPAILGVVAAALAIFLIKPVYESDALMLVQSAQVQDEVFAGLDNEVIDRRIARIRAEVVSRPNLVSLIERHRLYTDERKSEPLSQIITDMREAISLIPEAVEVPGGGRNEATISFRLAYQYVDPAATQAVTQDLMDRILELDASGNVQQATNTVQFLSDQALDLEERMAAVQGEIATLTLSNGSVLSNSGGSIIASNGGSYDVQIANLQRDNAMLVSQRAALQSSDTRDPAVLQAEAALAGARAVYTESHPDVAVAKQRLEQAKRLAISNQAKIPMQTLDQQIAFNNSQIAALRAAKQGEQAQVNSRIAAQSRAPVVQQQLASLQSDLAGLNSQYQDIQSRLGMARAGVKAEDEQVAERLSVVEPPIIPDEPIWPDRLLILAACIGGGLGLGMVMALGIELLTRPIRDPDGLAGILGEKPLAVVPILDAKLHTGSEPKSGWRRFVPGLKAAS